MKKCACCYTVTPNHILQAVVSAAQIRNFSTSIDFDIIILCFGDKSIDLSMIDDYCSVLSITLVRLSISDLQGLKIGCARLLINQFISDDYSDIIYLDADTQIRQPLQPLMLLEMGTSTIAAVSDPMAFVAGQSHGTGKASLEHFNQIGIPIDDHHFYFNTGVIRSNRGNWASISEEALKVINRSSRVLRYLDQDALNIVLGRNYIRASIKWNFPGFLMNSEVEKLTSPCVYHFMSKPRPWDGPFMPWGYPAFSPYVKLLEEIPGLRKISKKMSISSRIRYIIQGRAKRVYERRVWQSAEFIASVRRNEEASLI